MISRRLFLGATTALGFLKPTQNFGHPGLPPQPYEPWWKKDLLALPKGYTHWDIYTMADVDYNRLLAGYPAPRNDDFNLWWPL